MSALSDRLNEKFTPLMLSALLKGLGLRARFDPRFRNNIFQDIGHGREPWEAKVAFRTRDNSVVHHVIFQGGKIRSGRGPITNPDATFVLKDVAALRKMLIANPAESMDMLLRNELTFDGNMGTIVRVSYLLERLTAKKRPNENPRHDVLYKSSLAKPKKPLPAKRSDAVEHLDDPALSRWTVDDFPRLERFLTDFFSTRPAISTERPRLLTEHFKRHGFDKAPDGADRNPVLRQAEAFKYLMENRRPVIRSDDLIAGTTTDQHVGVVIYPDLGGLTIWPELYTMHLRELNPYTIAEEDRRLLNSEIFPYWQQRNMREVARLKAGDPECMKLDQRYVLYFQWKAHSLSHTIPDFPKVLSRGVSAIADDAGRREREAREQHQRDFYAAVRLCCEGVMAYAARLSAEARRLAVSAPDPGRKAEL
jgi:hypothetical protein